MDGEQVSKWNRDGEQDTRETPAAAHADADPYAARRERDTRTIVQMIAIYCKGNGHEATTSSAFGEPLCEDCAQLAAYASKRIAHCPAMAHKTSCGACEIHCYRPTERARIREVMRYAGPRMLLHHPAAAIRHAIGR